MWLRSLSISQQTGAKQSVNRPKIKLRTLPFKCPVVTMCIACAALRNYTFWNNVYLYMSCNSRINITVPTNIINGLYFLPGTKSIFRAFAKLRKATIKFVTSVCPSVCLSVCQSAWNNSAPTRRILVGFYTWRFFENMSIKIQVSLKLTRITGTLHEDLCTHMIISQSILFKIRNVSHKRCRENQNTRLMFINPPPRK